MLNEHDIIIGELYRVIKGASNLDALGPGALIGQIGKAKWANYRGVCLKFVFPDRSTDYVINYDCLEAVDAQKTQSNLKRPFRDVPTIRNVIRREYRYRFAKISDPPDPIFLGRIGQICKVSWINGAGRCQITFLDGDPGMCHLKNLEDVGG